MSRRLGFFAAALILIALLALLVWQGSFSFSFSPSDPRETILLWAVDTVIFLLAVTLAFMLFRVAVKLYLDRQKNREGSRIRSKLLFGALALTLAPALFSALFNYAVLNRTLEKWFTLPQRGIDVNLGDLDKSYRKEAQARVQAEASWIGFLPETVDAARNGHIDAGFFKLFCETRGVRQLILTPERGGVPMLLFQRFKVPAVTTITAEADVMDGRQKLGKLRLVSSMTNDPRQKETEIQRSMDAWKKLSGRGKFYHETYFLLILLLTLFVLFFAAWSAQILSRLISVPISALLEAAKEVRRGNLSYRIRVGAMDELATLVRGF